MNSGNGSDLFLETLIDEGVDCMFGNPGTTELPLMDALVNESRLDYILCLQESVTIGAAEGYAYATGGVGVVNLHVAPGLGNAMGMLYNIKRAGTPLIVTAGNQGQRGQLSEPVLWDDLPRMAEPLTKWSYEVRRVEDLEQSVRRAIKYALTPPTGPVFLSLPGDVMLAETGGLTGRPTRLSSAFPAPAESIERAAQTLAEAENPYIVTGSRVTRSGAVGEVVRLAERLGAKVFSDNRPNSLSVSLTHPLYAGELLNTIEPLLDQIEDADVVFFIGTETYTFSFPPEGPLAPRGARIIHLDLDPWEIGKNFPVDVAMLGDPKTTLTELTGAVEKKMGEAGLKSTAERRAWIEKELAASRREIAPKAGDDGGPLTKETFQAAFGEAIPQGTALVDESLTMGHGGGLKSAVAGKIDSLFGMKGGGIGLGLPSALGVKKALPDTPVVCLSGDGSAMYAIQALWSAAKYDLDAVFVILNNKSYRILKERVLRLDGKTQEHRQFVAMDFKEPELDFIQMAGSMGVDAVRAKTPAELKEAMGKGLAGGKPYLIDAHIEYERLEN